MKSRLLALLVAVAPLAHAADHSQRFAAAYARQNDADDVLAAVRAAQANGSADEKGWAANLLSTCQFTAIANLPAGLSPAGVQDWHTARDEANRRCAGVAALKRPEYDALGDELRDAGKASTSELGRLRHIGLTADGLAFRPATPDELKTLGAALRDDDPQVRSVAADVASSVIEQASDRAHTIAFIAVAAPSGLSASLGKLDALFACLVDGWCEHTHGEAIAQAWRAPADATQARLQRAYADALAHGRAMDEILKIR